MLKYIIDMVSRKKKCLGIMFFGLLVFPCMMFAQQIQPTWESLAENYKVPKWFVDGKIGVWFHYGIPSSIDENRPNDGSHYGRRMYGDKDFKF